MDHWSETPRTHTTASDCTLFLGPSCTNIFIQNVENQAKNLNKIILHMKVKFRYWNEDIITKYWLCVGTTLDCRTCCRLSAVSTLLLHASLVMDGMLLWSTFFPFLTILPEMTTETAENIFLWQYNLDIFNIIIRNYKCRHYWHRRSTHSWRRCWCWWPSGCWSGWWCPG